MVPEIVKSRCSMLYMYIVVVAAAVAVVAVAVAVLVLLVLLVLVQLVGVAVAVAAAVVAVVVGLVVLGVASGRTLRRYCRYRVKCMGAQACCYYPHALALYSFTLPPPEPSSNIRSSSLQSRQVGFETTKSGRAFRRYRKYRVEQMCS